MIDFELTSSMQVEDIDTICAQFLQALIDTLCKTIGLVLAWLVRITLGSQHQSTLLPFGISGESLLLSSNV